jgi:diphthamide synthase subunit DPH2
MITIDHSGFKITHNSQRVLIICLIFQEVTILEKARHKNVKRRGKKKSYKGSKLAIIHTSEGGRHAADAGHDLLGLHQRAFHGTFFSSSSLTSTCSSL